MTTSPLFVLIFYSCLSPLFFNFAGLVSLQVCSLSLDLVTSRPLQPHSFGSHSALYLSFQAYLAYHFMVFFTVGLILDIMRLLVLIPVFATVALGKHGHQEHYHERRDVVIITTTTLETVIAGAAPTVIEHQAPIHYEPALSAPYLHPFFSFPLSAPVSA